MFGFLDCGLRIVAFDCKSFECGYADPSFAPLKGHYGAVIATAKIGNLAGLDEIIPTILPEVALPIHEQVSQVPDDQIFGFWISG